MPGTDTLIYAQLTESLTEHISEHSCQIYLPCSFLGFSENPSYTNIAVAVYHRSDIPNPRINFVCPSVVKQDGFNSPLVLQHDNFHVI